METTSCITFCVLEQGLNTWPRPALNSQSWFSFSRAAVTFLNNVYIVLSVLFDNKKYAYVFPHFPSFSLFLLPLSLFLSSHVDSKEENLEYANLRSWASQVPENKADAWASLPSVCCFTCYIYIFRLYIDRFYFTSYVTMGIVIQRLSSRQKTIKTAQ